MRTIASVLLAATLTAVFTGVDADVYMHNPRGNNDRNCEVRLLASSEFVLPIAVVATRPACTYCSTFVIYSAM